VALARAYVQEGLSRPDRLLILIASAGPEVQGFLVVLRAPWDYWWGFLSRHPLLALRIGAHALRRAELTADEIPSRWHADTSGFQRILMIAVSASCRRGGVGRSLYTELFARGQQNCMALVSPGNQASMALHRATGWSIDSSGGNPLLATRKANTLSFPAGE
jgi:ribosomal protein S18 acetylase RimI-like enzyme